MPFEIVLIVLISVVSTFGFLTALVMTKHQQAMAALIAKQEGQGEVAGLAVEMARMQDEIGRLKDQVNQQAIELDQLKSLPSEGLVSERLTPPDFQRARES